MRLPSPPPPFRGFYDSDEAYQAAVRNHEKIMEQRNESDKTDMALHLLLGAVLTLIGVAALCFMAWISGGIRGLAYLFSVSGLLWVAFIQIRRRL